MTPKQQAEEIHEIMFDKIDELNAYDIDTANRVTRQCCIIAVDKVIDALEMFGYSGSYYDDFETGKMVSADQKCPTLYWRLVKQEIATL